MPEEKEKTSISKPVPKPKTDAEKYPCPEGFPPEKWKRKGVGFWRAYNHAVKGSEF